MTDRPVDLRDFRATLEHVLARTHPETDLYVFSNLSMDTLDYTGPAVNEGSKGVWLGLGDPVRELPREFRPEVAAAARSHRRAGLLRRLPRGGRAGLRGGSRSRRRASPRIRPSAAGRSSSSPTSRSARPRRPMNFLWTTFTRFEPAADIHAAATRVVRHHVVHEAAGPHRRAAEALVPEGGGLRPGHRGPRHPPLARVLPHRQGRDGRLGSRPPRPGALRASSAESQGILTRHHERIMMPSCAPPSPSTPMWPG